MFNDLHLVIVNIGQYHLEIILHLIFTMHFVSSSYISVLKTRKDEQHVM